MIDKNNGCIKESRLTITVKTLSKYNDWIRVAGKQANILRATEIDRYLGTKHIEGRKIHTYKQTQKQTYCGHTHTESQTKSKMKAPYVLLLLK